MVVQAVDAHLLRTVPLFADVGNQGFARLAATASLRHFAARVLLFAEGRRPQLLYTLLQGSVELYSEHHHRRVTIAVVRSVEPIVLPAVLDDDRNPMSGRTLEASRLLVVPVGVIRELIEADPAFARQAARELAGDYHRILEDFKNFRLRNTTERIARWLLQCDENAGRSGCFVIPFGKRVLASYLGMTPENLSRSLAALASAGVVIVDGRRVTLNNRAALTDAAG